MAEQHTGFEAIGKPITLGAGAAVYRQVWLQAEAIRAPAANPAVFSDHGITGAWEFADNLIRVVIAKLPLNLNMDKTQDATVRIGWSTPAQTKVCRWQIEYLFRKADEDTTAAAQGTLTQDETCSAVANGLNISDFTMPAAGIDADDVCLMLRVTRVGNHANDTLSDVANLIGICLYYASDKLGETI